ncbi:MAG: NUDIX hydrolase [Clostridia bacterium]|nr:NUDIX hydrolase [Clostridia bacterium]
MWKGGVRVIVLDENNRILMVKQHHPERDVWMVPGGSIEEGEDSVSAGIREVKEETGLNIEMKGLLWHVEEVSERGQRFVNFHLAKASCIRDDLKLGTDPELDADEQVLREIKFMRKEEVAALGNIYPEWLRYEFWGMLDEGELEYDAFRKRVQYIVKSKGE